MRWIVTVLAFVACAPPVWAAEPLRLAADSELEEAGLLDWLVPRFSLKTGIRIELVGSMAEADVAILRGEGAPAFRRADERWGIVHMGDAGAVRFAEWLTGDVGAATLAAFAPPKGAPFVAAAAPEDPVAPVVAVAGDGPGADLALRHCGRCHVVDRRNRMGGIGSTPSFGALRTLPDWRARFLGFWGLNPHPSFTQIEGVTEPFARRPHIAPVELSEVEVEAIADFAATIPPKDLGAPIAGR